MDQECSHFESRRSQCQKQVSVFLCQVLENSEPSIFEYLKDTL